MTSDPRPEASGLSSLPSVEKVRAAIDGDHPHEVVVGAARAAVDVARADVRAGLPIPSFEDIVARAVEKVEAHAESRLVPVINATGVLLHTNLGRAPLGDAQLAPVTEVAGGYSNLEYDIGSGSRGQRDAHARALLTTLTGAEAALVVNNNAAAVLVVLSALCSGRDVIISRGELIEIGGEFRIPDVMKLSGARLVEVGTTNRTNLTDYERAISAETAAILKVHPSNYRMVGFTAQVATRELAELARAHQLHLINDVGSGLIEEPSGASWVGSEPLVHGAIEDGADIVTFSGDKLLGGPQAGVMVGGAAVIERIAQHPLMRAVRIDKMTLAALEATLDLYLSGRMNELPLWRLAEAPLEDLEERARVIAGALSDALAPGWKVEARPSTAVAGGGTTPGTTLSSWAVAIGHAELTPDAIAAALRRATPAVIGRIDDDLVLLDLRSVLADLDATLTAAVTGSLG